MSLQSDWESQRYRLLKGKNNNCYLQPILKLKQLCVHRGSREIAMYKYMKLYHTAAGVLWEIVKHEPDDSIEGNQGCYYGSKQFFPPLLV